MNLYIQHPKWGGTNIYRQSSQFSGSINCHQWSSFPELEYDFIICGNTEELPQRLREQPKYKKVFLMHENPLVWRPSKELLNEYGVIISPFDMELNSGQRLIRAHSAVPWFYGIPFRTDCGLIHQPGKTNVELDTLQQQDPFNKTKCASFILSGKAGLPGHQWRIELAKALMRRDQNMFDIYGFGFRPITDKASALNAYQYSIVIENSESKYYWTEKLADCVIGGAMPIYAGAANAQNDLQLEFPQLKYGSDPTEAAEAIINIINSFNYNVQSLKRARSRVLDHLNMLAWIPYLLINN